MSLPSRHRVLTAPTKAAIEAQTWRLEVQGWRPLGEAVLTLDLSANNKPYWALALRWDHDFVPLELESVPA